jgi:hypothetical protein
MLGFSARQPAGFLLFALAACAMPGAEAPGQEIASPQQSAVASGCDAAAHRALDYLIGEWRIVETASGKFYADNQVERIHGGCGIRENLRMRGGVLGTSTSFFSSAERLWHMFFHDSLGFYAHLTGFTNREGRQELTTDVRFPASAAQVRKARQVFSRDETGRPRQIGYLMDPEDLGWRQVYDLTFCPANQALPDRKPPC